MIARMICVSLHGINPQRESSRPIQRDHRPNIRRKQLARSQTGHQLEDAQSWMVIGPHPNTGKFHLYVKYAMRKSSKPKDFVPITSLHADYPGKPLAHICAMSAQGSRFNVKTPNTSARRLLSPTLGPIVVLEHVLTPGQKWC